MLNIAGNQEKESTHRLGLWGVLLALEGHSQQDDHHRPCSSIIQGDSGLSALKAQPIPTGYVTLYRKIIPRKNGARTESDLRGCFRPRKGAASRLTESHQTFRAEE